MQLFNPLVSGYKSYRIEILIVKLKSHLPSSRYYKYTATSTRMIKMFLNSQDFNSYHTTSPIFLFYVAILKKINLTFSCDFEKKLLSDLYLFWSDAFNYFGLEDIFKHNSFLHELSPPPREKVKEVKMFVFWCSTTLVCTIFSLIVIWKVIAEKPKFAPPPQKRSKIAWIYDISGFHEFWLGSNLKSPVPFLTGLNVQKIEATKKFSK